jgi:hypothetical protein
MYVHWSFTLLIPLVVRGRGSWGEGLYIVHENPPLLTATPRICRPQWTPGHGTYLGCLLLLRCHYWHPPQPPLTLLCCAAGDVRTILPFYPLWGCEYPQNPLISLVCLVLLGGAGAREWEGEREQQIAW